MKYRIFVVGLPHTEVTKEFVSCAYTQKVLHFCNMMKDRGHEVILLAGGDKTEARVDEFISLISRKEQQEFFGIVDYGKEFYNIEWDENLPYWKLMAGRAIAEIAKRKEPKDFIALVTSYPFKLIKDSFPDCHTVEFAVGYKGIMDGFRAFESYAWMHWVYGRNNIEDGRNYDTVIPGYLDPKDFPFSNKKDDYLLYIGRMVRRKGVDLASEMAKRTHKRLILAGQGVKEYIPGKKLVTQEFTLLGDHFDYVGSVDVKRRGELMSKAYAVLVPTQYIEPFGNTHVEAMACGTPIITTDYGVFTETFRHGEHGFKFRTLGEAVWGIEQCQKLDYRTIREYAIANYSTDRVGELYEAWLNQLYGLWDAKDDFYGTGHLGVSKYKRYVKTLPGS